MGFSLVVTSGCATMQEMGIDKQGLGTALGGLAGVALGSQVGGGKGRVLAMALGGLAGAYIGGAIGKSLDEKDRAAAAQALDQLRDNDSTTFTNRESGKSTTFTVANTQQMNRNVPVVRKKEVQIAPSMQLVGKPYQALKSANVRNTPSTTGSTVINSLKAGESIVAVGKVTNQPWYMVARNDVTIGYVHESLIQPSSIQTAVVLRDAVDLDAMEKNVQAKPEFAAVDLDQDIVVEEVSMNSSCRDMSFSQAGKSEKFQACKATDGAWEII